MGTPACTTAVGLEVRVAAGAGESGWPWLDDCRFEVDDTPWLVGDEVVLTDLGGATDVWLAGCGMDAGTMLGRVAGGLGGATAGTAFIVGDTCAVAGAGEGYFTWLGVV